MEVVEMRWIGAQEDPWAASQVRYPGMASSRQEVRGLGLDGNQEKAQVKLQHFRQDSSELLVKELIWIDLLVGNLVLIS